MFSAKHPKKSVGDFGENLAAKYLIKCGWEIIFRNFKRKSDEIDIIAISPENVLVFLEIKTSLNFNNLKPEDNMTLKKYKKISRTCAFFSREYPQYINSDAGWRIDLIAIQIDAEHRVARLRHYENI